VDAQVASKVEEHTTDHHRTGFFKYQKEVRAFYLSKKIEVSVATLIVGNFLVGCLQAQIDPFYDKFPTMWDVFENFFNIVFFLELCVNMYGSWCKPFISSNWNRFDVIVVTIGMLSTCRVPLPGPLKLVRLLRAFRVFRLFGRIESLKKTVVMIQRALPGVCSAFMIAVLMLCIYAVLAVDFFKEDFDDCNERECTGNEYCGKTARGRCFGVEYYGNFLKALYTLFQILTGESWSEAAVRPVIMYHEDSLFETAGVGFFFLSFILINAIVIINVVVAFLIDGMGEKKEEPSVDENATPTPCEEVEALRSGVVAVNEQLDTFASDMQKRIEEILVVMKKQPETGDI